MALVLMAVVPGCARSTQRRRLAERARERGEGRELHSGYVFFFFGADYLVHDQKDS